MMRYTYKANFSVLLVCASAFFATAACDGDDMTVGQPPPPVIQEKATAIKAGDLWSGYIERFAFPSGSDRVTIAFSSPTSGTVSFGAGPHSAEPRTPTDERDFGEDKLIELFPFTMRDLTIDEDKRLRFEISLGEVWSSWCSSLSPVDQQGMNPPYRCAPPGASDGAGELGNRRCGVFATDPLLGGEPITEVPCDQVYACMGLCRCDATKCEASPDYDVLTFDVRLDVDKADGSTELGTVRLVKQ